MLEELLKSRLGLSLAGFSFPMSTVHHSAEETCCALSATDIPTKTDTKGLFVATGVGVYNLVK